MSTSPGLLGLPDSEKIRRFDALVTGPATSMTREEYVITAARAWKAAMLNRDGQQQYGVLLLEAERNLLTAIGVLNYRLRIPPTVVQTTYT